MKIKNDNIKQFNNLRPRQNFKNVEYSFPGTVKENYTFKLK